MIAAQDSFPWVTTWPEAFVVIAVAIAVAWVAVTMIRNG